MKGGVMPSAEIESGKRAGQVWPPQDRAVTGDDVHEFLDRFRLDINLMEAVFAIPSRRAWYQLAKEPNKPVNIAQAILIRFFSVYPHLLPFYSEESAEQLRERLNLSPAAFGLLVGRQEISVRQWSEEREPHKVVGHLLYLIRRCLTLIEGNDPVLNGEEMLADIVRFSFLEWTLRGESPSQRRSEGPATNIALFREVLNLVPHNSLARATEGFDLGDEAIKPKLSTSKAPAKADELAVTAEERRIATQSVRDRRKAGRALKDIAPTFKL